MREHFTELVTEDGWWNVETTFIKLDSSWRLEITNNETAIRWTTKEVLASSVEIYLPRAWQLSLMSFKLAPDLAQQSHLRELYILIGKVHVRST